MRFFKIFLGNIFISFAYACITVPKIIINGGVTSFSLVLSSMLNVSVTSLVNLVTLALLLLSLVFLGKRYFIGVLFSSLCYVLTFNFFYGLHYELVTPFWLAVLVSALLVASGYWLCISSEASAVSFDTLALILNKTSKHFDVAITMTVINILVLSMGLLVFSIKAVLAGVCFTILQGAFLKILLKNF